MSDIEYVTACYPCGQGLYAECLAPTESSDGLIIPCAVRYKAAEKTGNGGGALEPEDVTDPISTGRKRAALLAPFFPGMLCEWAGLRQAGGGVTPIVGCAGNQLTGKKNGDPETGWLASHRHHGPDKAVLNNAPGMNLHRVCAVCHNRWHAMNDPFYGKRGEANEQFLPLQEYYLHDANTEATVEEQELAEQWWETDKDKRPEYPIEPEGLRKIAP